MKKQRVYVAGPMTGLPDLNSPAFVAEVARLRAEGHEVLSPTEINAGLEHEGWHACMRRDIPVLLTCDAVQLLRGWQGSKGARIEAFLAAEFGLEVWQPVTRLDWSEVEA